MFVFLVALLASILAVVTPVVDAMTAVLMQLSPAESPLLMWSTVSGVVATFVTSALTPVDLPGQTKRLIALGVAVALSLPVVYLNGQLLPADLFMSALWTLFVAVTSYDYVWKPYGVSEAISNAVHSDDDPGGPNDPDIWRLA